MSGMRGEDDEHPANSSAVSFVRRVSKRCEE